MKHYLLSLLCLTLTLGLQAQSLQGYQYPYVENFGPAKERQLGAPYTAEGVELLPFGTDLWEGDENNTIHYGLVPANSSSKPVLVFVHGYASNAQVWLQGRDNMYADVYRDGYRSAFVSLTPNRHVWTNGNMLSKAIDKIKAKYGVQKVVLIGWSKGGVDCDAAMTHYGANAKVSRAFTLSTPHHGTAIAEFANSILLSLVNIIFMQDNDGTRSLQRGYMDYFRSVTDNNSKNTVPFTTIGGWGNGPLNRLDIPQEMLHWNGAAKADGGNDGVVPYSSSRRPGGTELFSGQRRESYWWGGWYYTGPSQTNLDHYEVTRGGLVWPYIKQRLQSGSNAIETPSTITPSSYNPNQSVESRMQLLVAQKGSKTLLVEPNTSKITLILGHKEGSKVAFRNPQGEMVALKPASTERLGEGAKNTYVLDKPMAGNYEISSAEAFAAIAIFEQGTTATLRRTDDARVYTPQADINLALDLVDGEGKTIEDALVTGVAVRTMDLQMNKTNDEPIAIAFKKVNGEFVAQWKGVKKPGIYNVTVTAQSSQAQRNVITSIAVAGEFNMEELAPSTINIEEVYPNPFHGKLSIKLALKASDASLTIYNIFGQEVQKFDLSGEAGMKQLEWDASGLERGMYIIQLADGDSKVAKKVILK